jgi:hypothetical protein
MTELPKNAEVVDRDGDNLIVRVPEVETFENEGGALAKTFEPDSDTVRIYFVGPNGYTDKTYGTLTKGDFRTVDAEEADRLVNLTDDENTLWEYPKG